MKIYHTIKNGVLSLTSKRTVGARILLIQDNQVLLVKHTYQNGWYTIGGGVESGETPRFAIERELKEEVGVSLFAQPELFAVYYSNREKRDDYIVFYIGREFTQKMVKSPEIADSQWFPLDALPEDATPATRRRVDEYLGRREITDLW